MKIEHITGNKKRFLSLLLLADEQESMIDRYLERGDLFVMYDVPDMPVALAVVTAEGPGVCELKNLAVSPSLQRKGYGSRMLDFLCNRYCATCHTLLVGTGDSVQTTSFYRKNGFVYSHTVPDFFLRNYDHPIIEEGKQLKDMIYFSKPR
jgi:ribosomal protein S18 acetylase RimI-like enzyme